jgi:hypothetical protein
VVHPVENVTAVLGREATLECIVDNVESFMVRA